MRHSVPRAGGIAMTRIVAIVAVAVAGLIGGVLFVRHKQNSENSTQYIA